MRSRRPVRGWPVPGMHSKCGSIGETSERGIRNVKDIDLCDVCSNQEIGKPLKHVWGDGNFEVSCPVYGFGPYVGDDLASWLVGCGFWSDGGRCETQHD